LIRDQLLRLSACNSGCGQLSTRYFDASGDHRPQVAVAERYIRKLDAMAEMSPRTIAEQKPACYTSGELR